MGKYIKQFATQAAYTAAQATFDLPNVSLITENMSVAFNPYVPAPTIEMVDLGLPSGLKWAKCNIGADTETDYGLFFSWGGTTGYADASSGKSFSWADYELGDGGNKASNMTKYNSTDGKTILEPEDDAAYQATNGALRMPTETECQELLNTTYVTNAWVTDYNGSGVNGRLFTSVSNGNTLFIPASGSCLGGSVLDRGSSGFVWSSSVSSSQLKFGRYLNIYSSNVLMGDCNRYCGQSVRGVSL